MVKLNRKLSCPDFAFPLLDFDNVLKIIQILGLKGVDIGLFQNRSYLQPVEEFKDIKGNARKLKEQTEKYELTVSDIFVQCDTNFHKYAANHMDDAEREVSRDIFLRTLAYAHEVGAHHVSALPGVVFEDGFDKSYDRCVKEQCWRVEKAREYGISYGCEAHIGSICEKPEVAKKLCEDSGMRLTLDYSHFLRNHQSDTVGDILIPYTTHFHMRGAYDGVLQAPMYDNTIDFKRIVKKLDENGYSGWYCAEYCWTPGWEDCYKNDNISDILLVKELLKNIK